MTDQPSSVKLDRAYNFWVHDQRGLFPLDDPEGFGSNQ